MPEFKVNSWNVSYSSICFFERLLKAHSKVENFKRTEDIFFSILRKNYGDTILTLLVSEYSLGVAALIRAKEEFPSVEYIVTSPGWNDYTREAKEYGRQNDLGVFTIRDFSGALHYKEPKLYVQKDSEGNRVYRYKDR